MRFLPRGPDIPNELVSTQEKGEVIFICGAGVSLTVGLPSFRGLVEGIYEELGEEWQPHPAEREGMRDGGSYFGQYDRVLRSLERRLAASNLPRQQGMRQRIRASIRTLLAPPDTELPDHAALLDLSRDENGQTRLVTTNFDTLFERAWRNVHGNQIASHAGPGMPLPKTAAFSGVLHLHGRLADNQLGHSETDLVLTSAEFGEAYLRSAWASRYVYDLARACAIVLVGYQADDPPMRYLLEVLEADRERYPDLRKVYAFAPIEADGDEERAIWEAKGAYPILYTKAEDGNHSALYEALREWRTYAEDPTAWRRARLTTITNAKPADLPEADIREALLLLQHGDASQLLGEIAPDASWLPVVASHRVFDKEETHPGLWLAKKVDDREMIRACAGLDYIDDRSRWHIERALEDDRDAMTPVRKQAWRMILRAKNVARSNHLNGRWFEARRYVRRGDIDHEIRCIAAEALRPKLTVAKPFLWPPETREPKDGQEATHHLLRIEYEGLRDWPPNEILNDWPQRLEEEVAFFKVIARTFDDAIEEAESSGFTTGYDQASADVASVSAHPQNAHRSGFYPITRALADLWQRIAEKNTATARELVEPWRSSPLLLVQRIHLHALSVPTVFTPAEAIMAIQDLDDDTFWVSDAQREIMRLLVLRWAEFSDEQRETVEKRLREGMPRKIFRADAYTDEDWASVQNHTIFRRLSRISGSGGVLSRESAELLQTISNRHPNWEPGQGDRDEFHSWHESRSGPSGHPESLASVDDKKLIDEALRLQNENQFEEGEVWRLLCRAEPGRALRALRSDAEKGVWREVAWRPFFWAADDIDDPDFQRAAAGLLAKAPNDSLAPLVSSGAFWLRKRAEAFRVSGEGDSVQLLQVWGKLADVTFGEHAQDEHNEPDDDPVFRSLNEAGGGLAWVLVELLAASNPEARSGVPQDLLPCFDRAVSAPGNAGMLARVHLGSNAAFLHAIDPDWTLANLVPLFDWTNKDATSMWRARAHDQVGSAVLFNALKPAFLQLFQRSDFPNSDLNQLISDLLSVAIWHRRPETTEYSLSSQETRRALTSAPASARGHAAWQLWRWMSDDEEPTDKGERWRTLIGPFFKDIWPLEARLRDRHTSQNLVLMALECGSEFPDAVDAVVNVITPYELYAIDSSLRLERGHSELVQRFPRAFVKLLNALIDPALFPVPEDLAHTLQQCLEAEAELANDPNYVRLYALRRRRGA